MKKVAEDKEQNDEIEYKLILLGDTSVGKTCLFKKITTGVFFDKNVSTIGIDRRTIKLQINLEEKGKNISKNITLHLIDTAGEERFKALTKNYYKDADGAVLLYDITDNKTFEHVEEWIESIKNSNTNINSNNKFSILLLGTKIDLIEEGNKKRQVELEEAKRKCQEYDLEWGGECSNLTFTDEQYKEIFKEFIKIIYSRIGFKKTNSQSRYKLETKHSQKKANNCPCSIKPV